MSQTNTQPEDFGEYLLNFAGNLMRMQARALSRHNDLTREPAGKIIEESDAERTKVLDAHYQTVQQCRIDGCESEAAWPFSTCRECRDEMGLGA